MPIYALMNCEDGWCEIVDTERFTVRQCHVIGWTRDKNVALRFQAMQNGDDGDYTGPAPALEPADTMPTRVDRHEGEHYHLELY